MKENVRPTLPRLIPQIIPRKDLRSYGEWDGLLQQTMFYKFFDAMGP